MDEDQDFKSDGTMQHFTATGRPYRPPQPAKEGWSYNSLAGADSYGAAPANLLPTRYTDESLIMIAVQRPENIGKAAPAKGKKSIFSFGRKSKEDFIMKKVPRGEYLKHYAKDDDGKYTGMEALIVARSC
jgi:hypothetical protein